MKIGIISDTHLNGDTSIAVPTWVRQAFAGVDLIIHAGDIEVEAVLDELGLIAPVQAVRGNVDWLDHLPISRLVPIDGGFAAVAHRLAEARRAWRPGVILLVHGHTHAGEIVEEPGLTIINPGSARKPRDGRPPSVVVAEVVAGQIRAEFKFKPQGVDE